MLQTQKSKTALSIRPLKQNKSTTNKSKPERTKRNRSKLNHEQEISLASGLPFCRRTELEPCLGRFRVQPALASRSGVGSAMRHRRAGDKQYMWDDVTDVDWTVRTRKFLFVAPMRLG